MTRRLGIQIGFAGSPQEREDIVKRVQIADDLGVESAWVAEAWGRDAFSILTQLALSTKKIQLGTAIVNVFSRTPAVLAMTFGTLDELSGGRAIIGLGSSGANVVEHWHGVKFDKPATRLREYIEIINMIMRREKLNYDGKIFKLARGFTMQFPAFRDHIPTYIASITPKSMEQTGEIADGWIPIYWPKDKIASGVETLMAGAKKPARRAPASPSPPRSSCRSRTPVPMSRSAWRRAVRSRSTSAAWAPTTTRCSSATASRRRSPRSRRAGPPATRRPPPPASPTACSTRRPSSAPSSVASRS